MIAATEDGDAVTRGNVFIYRGAGDPAENQPQIPPSGIVVTRLHNGQVFFGSKSITINGLSSACVDAVKIVFQASDDRENVTVSDRIVISPMDKFKVTRDIGDGPYRSSYMGLLISACLQVKTIHWMN